MNLDKLEYEFKKEYKCMVKDETPHIRVSFLYNSDASNVAQFLIGDEISFRYETDEIVLLVEDFNVLLRAAGESWGWI